MKQFIYMLTWKSLLIYVHYSHTIPPPRGEQQRWSLGYWFLINDRKLKNNKLSGTLDIGNSYSSDLRLIDLQTNLITEFNESNEVQNVQIMQTIIFCIIFFFLPYDHVLENVSLLDECYLLFSLLLSNVKELHQPFHVLLQT